MTKLVLWTPGLTALHRVLTAALLALVPPDAGLPAQLGYWLLLLLHTWGWRAPLPLLVAWAGCVALAWSGHNEWNLGTLTVMAFVWCGAVFARSRAAVFETLMIGLCSVGLLGAGLAHALDVGNNLLWPVVSMTCFAVGLSKRWRWLAWTGLLANGTVLYLLGAPIFLASVLLMPLAFSPAWIPRRRDALPLTVYYDGECGFCHRSVQFLMKEDPDGAALRFAPLQGTTFAARVPEAERAHLPDSIVVSDAAGALLVRSAAALRIGAALGGYWRPLAALGRLVPRPLRDAIYDAIARRRKRWFAKPDAHCPLLSPAERARFDP